MRACVRVSKCQAPRVHLRVYAHAGWQATRVRCDTVSAFDLTLGAVWAAPLLRLPPAAAATAAFSGGRGASCGSLASSVASGGGPPPPRPPPQLHREPLSHPTISAAAAPSAFYAADCRGVREETRVPSRRVTLLVPRVNSLRHNWLYQYLNRGRHPACGRHSACPLASWPGTLRAPRENLWSLCVTARQPSVTAPPALPRSG